MPKTINKVLPIQTKGVPFIDLNGDLTITNLNDSNFNQTYNLIFQDGKWFFSVNQTYPYNNGYTITINLVSDFKDGTQCQKQYVFNDEFFDSVVDLCPFSNGFSNGFCG